MAKLTKQEIEMLEKAEKKANFAKKFREKVLSKMSDAIFSIGEIPYVTAAFIVDNNERHEIRQEIRRIEDCLRGLKERIAKAQLIGLVVLLA